MAKCGRVIFPIAGILFGLAAADGQQLGPVPNDPLELATGPIQIVNTPEDRAAIIGLLTRARRNYQLRDAGQGYDLKVSFTSNSGGQTQYDGNWEMEEMFEPKLGTRMSASTGGFSTTGILSHGVFYADADAPLILHEARGSLFGPMPHYATTERDVIRTTAATLDGVPLTCVLLSGAGNKFIPASGRSWLENEDCIDPQTGLLRVHSLAPGRFALYDYTDSASFHGHVLPRTVTISEAGRPVLEVKVTSVEDLGQADPALFVATEQMKARGPGTQEAGAMKLPMFHGRSVGSVSSTIQPIVLFGLLKPTGEIEDLHSLQPSDPNSQSVVEESKSVRVPMHTAPGATPQQRFVFIVRASQSSVN